jgi:acylphosphatase
MRRKTDCLRDLVVEGWITGVSWVTNTECVALRNQVLGRVGEARDEVLSVARGNIMLGGS